METRTTSARQGRPPGLRVAAKRVALGALTALITVNLVTGGPILALWVGSRIQTAVGALSMGAVAATIVVLAVVTFILYKALSYVNGAYNQAVGRSVPRQQLPWHKPLTGESRTSQTKRPLSAVERIVIGAAVATVLGFEIWFFAFAHARLPG
jgi:cytochrome b subunit of formate dehydrogenase